MPAQMKRVVLWALFAFAIYAIITSPDRAADIVASVWDIIAEGFRNIGRFFENLVGD